MSRDDISSLYREEIEREDEETIEKGDRKEDREKMSMENEPRR